jgi:hypothetical protein
MRRTDRIRQLLRRPLGRRHAERHPSGPPPLPDPIFGQALRTAERWAAGALSCSHCGVPVREWRERQWVHTGERGTFWCRDELGLLTDTLAAPPSRPYPVAMGSVPAAVVAGIVLGSGRHGRDVA